MPTLYNEKKKASNSKYLSQFKTVSLRLLPGRLDEIKTAAAEAGESVAGYISEAIDARMNGKHDGMPNAPQPVDATPGGFTLPEEDRQNAQKAAEANGEELRAWIGRAITETAQRDEYARLLKR